MLTKQQAYKKLEGYVKDIVENYESDTFSSSGAELTYFDKQVLESRLIELMVDKFDDSLDGVLLACICEEQGLGAYKDG